MVPLGVLLPFLGVVFSCCGMHFWSRVTCLGPVHYLLFLRKDGQGDMFTVALGAMCVCATCCTYRNGVTPDALTMVIYLHVVLGSSCGGTGGRGEEPCPTKLPHPIPGNVPTLSAPGSLSGQLEGLHPSFSFSSHFMLCHS